MTVDTIGSTASNAAPSTGFILGDPITASTSGRLSSIGVQAVGNLTGNLRTAIYSTLTGTPTFTGLLGQSASTAWVLGWNDLAIPQLPRIVKGNTYYICFQVSQTATAVYSTAPGTGLYYAVSWGYGSFPDPTGTLSTAGNTRTWNMRITYTSQAVLTRNVIGV